MKLNAMVVEDSAQVAQRVVDMLLGAGLNVVANVGTEDQALQAIERNSIDVAVIDLQLVQGTGFGVIRRLREPGRAKVAAIIVITHHAVPALKVASFAAGADYFLDKSKDFSAIPRIAAELVALAA